MRAGFNEEFRFGSARWACRADLKHAGLFWCYGPKIGYWNGAPLYIQGDAPIITIGGAGSGKTRDLLGHVVCDSPGQRMMVVDPRGELGAISGHVHATYGEHALYWNPAGLCGLPQHSCNPLDFLDPTSNRLHTDCLYAAEALVSSSSNGEGKYFEERAREWIGSLLKSLCEVNGTVSLPELTDTVNAIEGDSEVWTAFLRRMLESVHLDVRRTAGEMLTKQTDSPKEFGSIMGTIYGSLTFLNDPMLRASLSEPDFSLSDLVDPDQVRKIFLNIPAEYIGIWSPLIRLMFTAVMLYKGRAPEAPQVMLICDEAGQLGKFDALLRSFTFGRGAGIRAWAIFQDIGQIKKHYGDAGLISFMGSAQTRQFFGVRDFQTAKLISDMAGYETLHYDDELRQAQARHKRSKAMASVLTGRSDPFDAALEIAHLEEDERRQSQQARLLITPAEVMAMPEDRQVLFISGKNLPPLLAWKHPYYERREMAGKFLPNPYHPPADRVRIKTRFGHKWLPVLECEPPKKFQTFPQYRGRPMRYSQGFKPR